MNIHIGPFMDLFVLIDEDKKTHELMLAGLVIIQNGTTD